MAAEIAHDPPERAAGKLGRKQLWRLRLYVAGKTSRCVAAESALRRLCRQHLPGRHRIEVIDILEDPAVAKRDQILAIPTIVRRLPRPIRKTIGNLGNIQRVLMGLGIEEEVA